MFHPAELRLTGSENLDEGMHVITKPSDINILAGRVSQLIFG
jgi:hypothetical protein